MPSPADHAMDSALLALLNEGLEQEASDLHLVTGYPPTFRVHGMLRPSGGRIVDADATARMIASIMPAQLRGRLDQQKDFDFSMSLPEADAAETNLVRFRVNVFLNQRSLGACLRFIPRTIPTFEWMGIPTELAHRVVDLPNGLVLITGVTGAGKTTTLAGLVELMNQSGDSRIVTIEEPVEYLFKPAAGSVITQREVGVDVDSFSEGLKYSLRQDPDVILCGEIRDIDTARMALSAAETGHLVLTTVHTQDAKGAITRLVDIFPPERQQDIRSQLSLCLRFVLSQHLLPNAISGERRVLAMEILYVNDAVRAAIRLNKIESIETLIQTGRKFGMQTLDEHLASLVVNRRIKPEVAHRYAKNPDGLRSMGVPDSRGGEWV